MLERALVQGFSPEWVLADEVYGSDSKFRRFLDEREQPYVLAVSSQQRVWVALRQERLDALVKTISAEHWFQLSVGDGAKGPRVYDWAAASFGVPVTDNLHRWVLFRRNIEKPEEYAYYLCLAPAGVGVEALAQAAGLRWHIECCFEAGKQETGLDAYEVRSWHGWYRHITLSILALVFLSVVRLRVKGKKKEGLVPVTEPEIRRLMLLIVWPHLMDAEKALVWSYWRRRHQAIARDYHYKKRKSCKLQL
jgi:SRSO17 transposase